MISQNIITEIANKDDVGWAIIEKDYFLTLLLEGIANNPCLKDVLVFKGGTVLRKIYFKKYRYSEDLDFTLKKSLTEKEIKIALDDIFKYLKKEYNADFQIKSLYSRKWFNDIKVQFIGVKGGKNIITLDLMFDEIIVDNIKEKSVLNPYYKKNFLIPVYSLDEILAEKLRSLLQRTRVRDYYNIWYILTNAKNKINNKKVKEIFIKKVKYKKLSFSNKNQLINPYKIEQARAYYERQISHQIKNPPSFDKLIKELEQLITSFDL